MPLIGRIENLVTTTKEEIYNFFIDDKQRLNYIYSLKRKWLSQETLNTSSVMAIDIEIDVNDDIHVVTIGSDHSVKYYNISNNQIKKTVVLQKNVKGINLFYPKIHLRDSLIDIYFYQQLSDRKCQLVHLVLKEEVTKAEIVTESTFNKYINPFKIFHYNNIVYVLYLDFVNDSEEIFCKSYSLEDNQMTFMLQLTNTGIRKLYLDGLIDGEDHLQLVWSNFTEDRLQISHCKYSLKDLRSEMDTKAKVTLLSEPLNASFPYLLLYNDTLKVIWYQYNNLAASTSRDLGESWSNPFMISESKGKPFKRYKYRVLNPTNGFIGDVLYGSTYPQIQFLGLGGDNNDEVSTQS
ncbi:hypothetical protein [Alkaliphilus serpentinus]|uniref:BNR repeat-containing family member n=1 Tax=Alkaliphilus serpentinus TaxID=1482731 RepID=A0A833HME8_9FIRM|nr:hypothetical protein [Alkaliphilus serpentinus]KAB3527644.1 hypothetical protein F8153_11725 [Alkaliphilus serpentinus]